MIVFRRRLIFWILKEYVKKWGKTILLSFVVGLAFFFTIRLFLPSLITKMPIAKRETIGIIGAYTLDTLPPFIVRELSRGLTVSGQNGLPEHDIATSWKIEDDGKRYVFFLRKDASFSDGTSLTSNNLLYNFSDATMTKQGPYTVTFTLKESYTPFLTTVTRPIFKKNFVGLGEYEILNVKLNGNFIQTLTLGSTKNRYISKKYIFYPTADALRMAYLLGEVSSAVGVTDVTFKKTSLSSYPNTDIIKRVNDRKLVTLFYNVNDQTISDKRLRSALSYALPDTFSQGKRAYLPFPSSSWAYASQYANTQDIAHSKLLMEDIESATNSEKLTLSLQTFPRYKDVADTVAKEWKKIGIQTAVKVIDDTPDSFQIFLGDFNVSDDPDQYSLWHSRQNNNITNYSNLRIDKLLEDGRKISDIKERKKIYGDFQKYLLADPPAAFLYFPYEYDLTRK